MTTRYDVAGTQATFEPGSDEQVLANKLGITASTDMDEAELVLLQKLYESVLADSLPLGRLTMAIIRSWHQRWLGNIYPWAGQIRIVNMSKDGFPFAPAAQLPRLVNEFDKTYLARYTPCVGMPRAKLVEAIAIVHVEFILLHPFREGNGRISRLLADVMAAQAGCGPMDYTSWEGQRKAYIGAIQAGLGCEYGMMQEFVDEALTGC